jgi:hypothetical protein
MRPCRKGSHWLSFAFTSALDSNRNRHVSKKPFAEAQWSGDRPLLREQESQRIQKKQNNIKAAIFKRQCRRDRTCYLLHSRQLWTPTEIDMPRSDLEKINGAAETIHCKNKRVKTSKIIKKQRRHFHMRMYRGCTSYLLHSRQLWTPTEIDMSQKNHLLKHNGAAETIHCENKRVKTSEVIKKQRSHFHAPV